MSPETLPPVHPPYVPTMLILIHTGTPQNYGQVQGVSNIEAIHQLASPNSKNSILRTTQNNSSILQDLGNDFRYVAPNLMIATFYETLTSKLGGRSLNVSLKLAEDEETYFRAYSS